MTELTQHNYAEIHPDNIQEGDTILWQKGNEANWVEVEVEVRYVAARDRQSWLLSSGKHFLVKRRAYPELSILVRKDRDPDYHTYVLLRGKWEALGIHSPQPDDKVTTLIDNGFWEILEPKDS